MKQIYLNYYTVDDTTFILGSYKGELCLLDFRDRKMRKQIDARIQKALGAEYVEDDNPLLEEVKKQLDEYFKGERKVFDVPLLMIGTDFQKSVWKALLEVPYGTTSSYLKLAKDIGNEKAVRAVANANGANAIGIIIPCHRIIGSDGTLTGYAGGLHLKKRLLELEGSH